MPKLGGKRTWKDWLIDVLFDLAGAFIFSIGIHCFIAPNQIAPGGVSGLSIILNHLAHVPIGTASLLFNIPLLLAGYKLLGRMFTFSTLKTVLILSFVMDVVMLPIPVYHGDPLISALFGGMLVGAGLAVIFTRGSTTGGSDIIARMVQQRMPHIQLGKALLAFDFCVILLSVVIFQNIETGLYGVICIFTTSKVVDAILYGMDTGKMVLIISDKHKALASAILMELNKGVTVLEGHGGYSGVEREILLCAIRKNQFHKLKKLVHEVDPRAFMIVTEAGEILGEGFKPIQGA